MISRFEEQQQNDIKAVLRHLYEKAVIISQTKDNQQEKRTVLRLALKSIVRIINRTKNATPGGSIN